MVSEPAMIMGSGKGRARSRGIPQMERVSEKVTPRFVFVAGVVFALSLGKLEPSHHAPLSPRPFLFNITQQHYPFTDTPAIHTPSGILGCVSFDGCCWLHYRRG